MLLLKENVIPLVDIDNNSHIINQWSKFVKYGKVPINVNQEVVKSWERSKELNIDAYGGKSNIILTMEELNGKLEEYKKLIDITIPYIDNILRTIKGLGYIVFLTESEGNILYVGGDEKVLEDFNQIYNFRVGAAWSEEAVGTTAVSMVISEGNPVPFMANEKYCYELKKRACSAVPIRNIDDEIIAILGIAASFPRPNYQLIGILVAAQMAIENQLRILKMDEKLHLINNYYKAIFDSVSDAIITVDSNGIITDVNEMAKEILREDNDKLTGKKAKDVLEFYPVILNVLRTRREFLGNKVLIDTKDKKFHYNIKRVIPILNDNDGINGCINIFQKIEKYKGSNSANRINNGARFTFNDIIGKSKEIVKVKKQAKVAAESHYNVLITGESGTGKEVFAQAIHNASLRANGPFIAVNCGAIPKDLIESEFFGYEAGAFTGASKNGRKGKFEQANKGTIFLDEIGEMPKNLQIRLLRVLQEREITRIGGSKTIPVDVRVIVATNKDLVQEVKKDKFRADLFWRLNVIAIHIPPLSKRHKDIPILMEYFIKKYSRKSQMRYILDRSTLNVLSNYSWPGNVRELENVSKRILAFTDSSIILPEHLPDYIISQSRQLDFSSIYSLEETEKQVIERVLDECDGNITRASKLLGISRPTLYKKLKYTSKA